MPLSLGKRRVLLFREVTRVKVRDVYGTEPEACPQLRGVDVSGHTCCGGNLGAAGRDSGKITGVY